MNPWRTNLLASAREIIRFGLNLFAVAAAVMGGVFGTVLLYQFLTHLWGFLQRHYFTRPW